MHEGEKLTQPNENAKQNNEDLRIVATIKEALIEGRISNLREALINLKTNKKRAQKVIGQLNDLMGTVTQYSETCSSSPKGSEPNLSKPDDAINAIYQTLPRY
jgi:hypothetical protein